MSYQIKATGNHKYKVDYARLPIELGVLACQKLRLPYMIMEQPSIYCTYPINVDPKDQKELEDKTAYIRMLEGPQSYNVSLHDLDYRGQRINREHWTEGFSTREKGVDTGMSVSMVRRAAERTAPDLFIVVTGDQDFVPALQEIQRLGKKVFIASTRQSCATKLLDQANGVIWLDNKMLERIEHKNRRYSLERYSLPSIISWPKKIVRTTMKLERTESWS